MQKISLIPYNCGAGAAIKSCADGATALREWGLAEYLNQCGIDASWVPSSPTDYGVNNTHSNVATVLNHCIQLKNSVQDILQSGGFPITIGGDHSMAVGTWTGVADILHSRRKLGLIWMDAHMDAHTAQTSHTGNRHGMPMSYLLGYGDDAIADITGMAPVIVPHQLCVVGIRSFEKEEAALLDKIGAKVFTMDDVRKQGLEEVMLEAVKIVSAHTAGFGISIDLDAFDPTIAPGTGTLEPGGILKEEFISAMQNALSGYRENLLALEIAEYNPHMDSESVTATLIADIISVVVRG